MTADDKTPQFLRPIRWVKAQGRSIDEMCQNLMNDPNSAQLFETGDVMLIWVNEGDITMQDMNIWIYNQNLALGTLGDPDDGI